MSSDVSTTPAVLARAAREFGDAEAIAYGDTRIGYADLLDRVRTTARALIARGVEPGDRIALWAPNTHHWVIAALATHYVGAAVVPINTRYTGSEALDLVVRTKATALFVVGPFLGTDRWAELTRAATPGDLEHLSTVIRIPFDEAEAADGVLEWSALDALAESVPAEVADASAQAVGPDDIADILFTSGTTGKSKGVLSAHRQTLGAARAWAECAGVTDADRYLIINPFFHSFGYKAGMAVCLLTGATMVPMAIFDVPKVAAMIAKERISVLPGAPTVHQSILDLPTRDDHDLSSLRIAVTGAAAVPVTLVERMQSELSYKAVLTAYGQTEAVVVTMCRTDDDPVTVSTTSGRAVPGMEVRIGDHGEILVRGDDVMLGYLDDPEATATTIDADGWLHTGDVGVMDERGYIDITDRLKDMYISGGFNVYPAEVENTLARIDAVAESAVIGVPDERMGEVGRAYVVAKPGRTITSDEVLAYCKEHLANFKIPRSVRVVGSLPRNPSGKVMKNDLRENKS